jgi:hypothetical protein
VESLLELRGAQHALQLVLRVHLVELRHGPLDLRFRGAASAGRAAAPRAAGHVFALSPRRTAPPAASSSGP